MKKLFFIVLLCFVSLFKSQSSIPVKYSEVVKVDSILNASTLYSNAKIWFVNNFKNPKEVILLDDPDNKTLLGRGNMKYRSKIFIGSGAREGWITFDISIVCKDGRYKYEFTNFTHKGDSVNMGLITDDEILSSLPGPEGHKRKVSNEVREIIQNTISPLIIDLNSNMSKKLPSKEDW
ncbi:DUF4468 domain-containing protein [Chryseobacterium arthrosphaerae]